MIDQKYIIGGLVGAVVGSIITVKAGLKAGIIIPSPKTIQKDYVNPSKLEIIVQDLDNNGIPETVLQYQGKAYLLKVDAAGKPVVEYYNSGSAK